MICQSVLIAHGDFRQAPGFDHTTQQDLFYASPVSYLQTVFPYPPVPLHETTTSLAMKTIPSHIILFSALLGQEEVLETGYKVSVREALGELGYEEVWRGWNGFDWAQDEAERRGGVRIWRLDEAVSI